jgi:hypothetical protein
MKDNLETTRSTEHTITGQMVDIEELTDKKPNPLARETGNLDTLTTKDKPATGLAVRNSTRPNMSESVERLQRTT